MGKPRKTLQGKENRHGNATWHEAGEAVGSHDPFNIGMSRLELEGLFKDAPYTTERKACLL